MNFETLVMSYHYECERRERRELMEEICHGDYGTYICRCEGERGSWRCLTSMGICFVVNPIKNLIVTAYPCTPSQVREICKNAGVHLSNSLQKRVAKNQTKINKIYYKKVA